jgi:hypothetical protein
VIWLGVKGDRAIAHPLPRVDTRAIHLIGLTVGLRVKGVKDDRARG